MKKWGLIGCLLGLLLLSERAVAESPAASHKTETPGAATPALAAFPKDKLGAPVLFGSRLLESNRVRGKVFAPGQRNPFPLLREFVRTYEGVLMRPLHYHSPEGFRPQMPKIPSPPVLFPVVRESADSLWLDVSDYFSTYPEAISVVPKKFLTERADSAVFLGIRTRERYIQVVNRYVYSSGLALKTACSFIFLNPEAMLIRRVDKTRVGYNEMEFRDSLGKRVEGIRKWDLSDGRPLVFYVDSACPAEWVPYIKEGLEDWNKALARLGLSSRIEVRLEPEQSLTLRRDPLVNWVRILDVDEANAKGDVLIDPRSGEILQADILLWRGLPRLLCDWRYLQTGAADPAARAEEYPIEMLGPMLRYCICHEMGHVLGLSHNMGASYAYPTAALHKPDFTQEYGTAASVMDYARFNHLATAADVKRGVNLLPPRLGPYDYYAIAWGYGNNVSAEPEASFPYAPSPGPYCYFAPFQSASIPTDPSALPEALGDDLLASSKAALDNCRTLITLDGLTEHRMQLLRRYYYRRIYLTLSNIGGAIGDKPVSESVRSQTVNFIFESLAKVPPQLFDEKWQRQILAELTGNFLPVRLLGSPGAKKALERHYRQLRRLHRAYPDLPLAEPSDWVY